VRLAVVRGAGRWFCRGVVDSGGDWEMRHDWIAAVGSLTVPVLAVIAGDAIAEGAELALACDLRIASRAARFAFPQMLTGRLPRHGATQRLPRLIGRMRALDLLLSGRPVEAREAERIGLVSRIVPAGKLATAVRQAVAELSAKGPIALRLAKEAVLKGADLTFEQGVRLEQDLYVLLQTTADRAEGINAFLSKRPPRFTGK
jgi:enoyl-CoA hydratase/carnithine racemase